MELKMVKLKKKVDQPKEVNKIKAKIEVKTKSKKKIDKKEPAKKNLSILDKIKNIASKK